MGRTFGPGAWPRALSGRHAGVGDWPFARRHHGLCHQSRARPGPAYRTRAAAHPQERRIELAVRPGAGTGAAAGRGAGGSDDPVGWLLIAGLLTGGLLEAYSR